MLSAADTDAEGVRMIKKLIKQIKNELNIGVNLAELHPPSNPQNTCSIRISEGEYVHQTGIDALVSFIPEDLSWQGPINSILLREVGQRLDDYILENVVSPKRGQVFAVPASIWDGPRLFFAVVPKWDGGMDDEERVLKRCFRNALLLAEKEKIAVLAMPALGAGRKDFPIRKAGRLVLNAIRMHHAKSIQEVRIVCKTSEMMAAYRELFTS